MTPGFKDYLREAFNAKPLGMFVAPNWIGLMAFVLLGLLNPGFWLLGFGLELGYLFALTGNLRFRHWVDARLASGVADDWHEQLAERVRNLPFADTERFWALERRCQAVLAQQQATGTATDLQLQQEGLGRLLWIYLGVMQTHHTLMQIMQNTGETPMEKIRRLELQLEQETDENLRTSFAGQLEILHQRQATQQEGRNKIGYLEAELDRIEQQVELIREQALLAGDAGSVARRIDEVGATLGGTTQWIRDQQKIYGEVQDLIEDAPPLPLRESQ